MVLPIKKFPSLLLPRNAKMLQHLVIQFLVYKISFKWSFMEVKSKRNNFKLFSLKVVVVTDKRW